MGEMRQSPVLRAQLRAVWEAHPRVQQHTAAIRAYALEHGLVFDASGMSEALVFATREIKENGPLPESGILVG